MNALDETAATLHTLADRLTDLSATHPGAQVIRSRVGNLSILDARQQYIGWADILTGTVTLIESAR